MSMRRCAFKSNAVPLTGGTRSHPKVTYQVSSVTKSSFTASIQSVWKKQLRGWRDAGDGSGNPRTHAMPVRVTGTQCPGGRDKGSWNKWDSYSSQSGEFWVQMRHSAWICKMKSDHGDTNITSGFTCICTNIHAKPHVRGIWQREQGGGSRSSQNRVQGQTGPQCEIPSKRTKPKQKESACPNLQSFLSFQE